MSRAPHALIRWTLLAVLTLVGAALAASYLERPRGGGRPLPALSAGEGVAQRALRIDSTRTRRGLPSFRVTAREALTYDEGNLELRDVVVTVYGPDEERTEVSAPLALSGPSRAGGWSFQNGVEIRAGDGLSLHVPELKYRDSPQEVASEGEVAFARGDLKGSSRGLRYLIARRRLELLSAVEVEGRRRGAGTLRIHAASAAFESGASRVTFSDYRLRTEGEEEITGRALAVVLGGDDSRIERLEATEGFTASAPAASGAAGLLGPGARSLQGETLAVKFLAEGVADSLEAAGGVRMLASDPAGTERSLDCGRLKVAFEKGRAAALDAEEGATLVLPQPPGRGAGEVTLRAGSLQAALDTGDGTIRSVRAEGRASAQEGDRRMEAEAMSFDAAANIWILSGGPEGGARVETPESSVAADRIEVRRAEGTLIARGRVKTVAARVPSQEGAQAGAASGLFGGAGSPIHGMCEALTLSRGGKVARYRDRVRLWQGSGSLEAAAVDLQEESGTLEARGGVVTRAPAAQRGAAAPRTITVSSSEMRYDRARREAAFSGGVRAVAGGMRIEAAGLTAKGGEGGAGLTELAAEEKVRFQQGTRSGEGDALSAYLKEDRFVLSGRGRLAIIQDQSSQQVVRGAVLTYEGGADRILVESETGGRTWITLRPQAEKGTKSDPEPPH